jgi:beta propeller repeat protein
VVWVEGSDVNWDIYGHNLETGQSFPVVTHPSRQEFPAISGNIVVWADRRHITAQHDGSHYDVYGYDLAAKREFRITTETAAIGQPAISGNTVVWWRFANAAYQIIAYDIATKQQRVLVDLGLNLLEGVVDVDGNLVVWSSKGARDHDVFGYDLAQGQAFIVSRAIGGQVRPSISGQRVVWEDTRHSGIGTSDFNSDVYGARLEAGSAPMPPAIGDPGAADARIEIVWPHGGAPVTEADRANIVSWLFQPGTMDLAACQWNPNVQLWRAVNSEPAERVATGLKVARSGVVSRAIPDWQFNDVDVSAAREPQNRVYFFVTVEGAASRSNVWAHAADARTNFPQQDTPTGTAPVSDTVAAKIEIVWPHGGASVSEAQKANISAMLFAPGSLASVPPDSNPTVRLLRAQNNGVLEEVAVGERRLAEAGGVSYPVWDFNDVDVSAARDPQNKLYFMVSVDGLQTLPNVWVHGMDARTYFPEMDVPTSPCP